MSGGRALKPRLASSTAPTLRLTQPMGLAAGRKPISLRLYGAVKVQKASIICRFSLYIIQPNDK